MLGMSKYLSSEFQSLNFQIKNVHFTLSLSSRCCQSPPWMNTSSGWSWAAFLSSHLVLPFGKVIQCKPHGGALMLLPPPPLICTHLYQFPCRWFSACPDVPKKILRLCSEKAAVKFQIIEHFIQHNLLAALCHAHIHAKGCSRVAVDLDLWCDLRGLDLEKKERKGVGLGPN